MAFVEGGAFKCSGQDFETESVAEWNKHCQEHTVHTESGETRCITCGDKVFFEGLPFHPIDEKTGSKNIALRCEDCDNKTMGSVKRTSTTSNKQDQGESK